jgi:CDP-glucose 4,6-dehydratase
LGLVGLNPAHLQWSGTPVFITGGSGVIGSWLTRSLVEEGADVTLLLPELDHRSELFRGGIADNTRIVMGRLEDFDVVEQVVAVHEPEVIFHLGAQTLVEPALRAPLGTFESNVRGTYHVLEAARRNADVTRGVVVASSDKAYGDTNGVPYTESMPVQSGSPYETSKATADLIAQSYAQTYGLPVTIARLGNVFGGGDLNWSRLVPGTIRSLLLDRTPEIRSDGTYVRDFLYVKDAAEAYLSLGRSLEVTDVAGKAFNFSAGSPMTVMDAYAAICRAAGREAEPQILDRARAEIKDQRLDTSVATQILGWKPSHPFDDALVETVEWYRDFLGATPQ